MTTLTTAVAIEPTTAPHAVPRPIPLTRLVSVEVRKMFDTRSGFWLMASIVIASVLATAAVILWAPDAELTYSTYASAIGFPMAVILPMIAILSVTSEWSQRSGLTSFTLVPHRGRVIGAKAVAALCIAVASMAIAFAIGALGNLLGTSITGTDLVWDVSMTEASLIVIGNVLGLLVGFMLGVLIRNSPGAVVTYMVYSFVLPPISMVLAASQRWFRDVQMWVDFNTAQTPLFDFTGGLTGQEWAQLGVSGVFWLALPLALGVWLVLRSEVK